MLLFRFCILVGILDLYLMYKAALRERVQLLVLIGWLSGNVWEYWYCEFLPGVLYCSDFLNKKEHLDSRGTVTEYIFFIIKIHLYKNNALNFVVSKNLLNIIKFVTIALVWQYIQNWTWYTYIFAFINLSLLGIEGEVHILWTMDVGLQYWHLAVSSLGSLRGYSVFLKAVLC